MNFEVAPYMCLIYLFTIKELINIDYETFTELSGTLQKIQYQQQEIQILYLTKHLTELTSINMPHVCTQNTTRLKAGFKELICKHNIVALIFPSSRMNLAFKLSSDVPYTVPHMDKNLLYCPHKDCLNPTATICKQGIYFYVS